MLEITVFISVQIKWLSSPLIFFFNLFILQSDFIKSANIIADNIVRILKMLQLVGYSNLAPIYLSLVKASTLKARIFYV